MAAEDYYNPKTHKGPSCSAREYATRCMPTVNYHDSKACKVQFRRASARRLSIARKRDVLAKVGKVDDLSLRDDIIHSVLLPPYEAKSRGLDGGKWENVYGPAAAWWAMEFWPDGDFRGYRRVVDGAWIASHYEKHRLPNWFYESDDYDTESEDDHIAWIIDAVRDNLRFGLQLGWLARARTLQMWRDRGEIIGDEPDPCPPC